MAWLLGAIVQKVDRPAAFLWLLHLRLPGRSIAFGIVATRRAVAVGPLAVLPAKRASADAEAMRWRKELEGARVIELSVRPGRRWARVVLARGGEQRAIVASPDGARLHLDLGAGPLGELEADDADEPRLAEAIARALEAELAHARDERRRALVAAIDRAAHKLDRRIEAVRADLAKIAQADDLVARGKLLAAHAHVIPRGAREATIEDWSTGEPQAVRVTLDPALTARAQAEALFQRAKRMRRGAPIATQRLAEARRAREALDALRERALAANDEPAVEAIERELGPRARATQGTLRGKGAPPEPRLPYHRFQSGERAILVGRGAKDNDALTTKIARPHDLWLHAKGTTGAHVVVPLAKEESCPPALLVDAAHLAAHFSDARGEKVVEVTYAPRRHVRKPRGSPPGAVVVEREKVLVLRVEETRIAHLLSSSKIV